MAKKSKAKGGANTGSMRSCIKGQVQKGKNFRAALAICGQQRGKAKKK